MERGRKLYGRFLEEFFERHRDRLRGPRSQVVKFIASELGISERHARNVLRKLREMGLVEVRRSYKLVPTGWVVVPREVYKCEGCGRLVGPEEVAHVYTDGGEQLLCALCVARLYSASVRVTSNVRSERSGP